MAASDDGDDEYYAFSFDTESWGGELKLHPVGSKGIVLDDESLPRRKESLVEQDHLNSRPPSPPVRLSVEDIGNTAIMGELCKTPVDAQVVSKLAAKHTLSVNLPNIKGDTALHYACTVIESKWSQEEVTKTLLKNGANLYITNNSRRTPFSSMTQNSEDSSFITVCQAIKNYQHTTEGRIEFYTAFEKAHVLRSSTTQLSEVFFHKDLPMMYVYHCGMLRLMECRGCRAFALAEDAVCQGIDTDATFRVRSLQEGEGEELALLPNGAILAIRRIRAERKKKTRRIGRPSSAAAPEEVDHLVPLFPRPASSQIRLQSFGLSPLRKTGIGSISRRGMAISFATAENERGRVLRSFDIGPNGQVLGSPCPVDDYLMTVEVVIQSNPATRFMKSYKSESNNVCCDVATPASGGLMAFARAAPHSSNIQFFRFEVVVFPPRVSMKAGFRALGGVKDDSEPVGKLSQYTKVIQGDPVAVHYAKSGFFVCLAWSSAEDMVTVFSEGMGGIFFNVEMSCSARPLSVHSRIASDSEVDVGKKSPLVAICTERSVEVHALSCSKRDILRLQQSGSARNSPRAISRPSTPSSSRQHSTALILNIHNSRGAGEYAAFFHPVSGDLVLLRGTTTNIDLCVADIPSRRNYFLCRIEACTEMSEGSTSNVVFNISSDGRYLVRFNDELCVIHSWADLAKYKSDNPKKYVNMTFVPLPSALGVDRYRVTAPTGFITLVFTDVQQSTELWERLPQEMQESLEMHNNLMRKLMLRFGGYEVKTEGDAFMVAFTHPIDALNWCLSVQLYLLVLPWPPSLLALCPEVLRTSEEKAEDQKKDDTEEDDSSLEAVAGLDLIDRPYTDFLWRGLRVRMGMHCCHPLCRDDPETGRMDYFGPSVNLAARVAGFGKGGQLVISPEVYDELCLDPRHGFNRRSPICDIEVNPLGAVRLKGIRDEKSLFEVLPAPLKRRSEDFAHNRGTLSLTKRSSSISYGHSPAQQTRRMPATPQGAVDSQKLWPCELPSPVKRTVSIGSATVIDSSKPGSPTLSPVVPQGVVPRPKCHVCTHVFSSISYRYCGICGARRRFNFDL